MKYSKLADYMQEKETITKANKWRPSKTAYFSRATVRTLRMIANKGVSDNDRAI